MKKAVSHFSCGATSTIATMKALEKFDSVEIVYADPGAEHPDNMRFLKDCEEKLFHQKVTIVRSSKYKDIFEVFEHKKFLSGPAGAPCTLEMKKLPIRNYLGERLYDEVQVFGFDAGEKKRIERFKNNNFDLNVWLPLWDEGISKPDCLKILKDNNIELPAMYKLGFPNANCIGCVKAANFTYWKKIKKAFPETFDWFAKFERVIGKKIDGVPKGASINRRTIKGVKHRVFLDNLDSVKTKEDEKEKQMDFFCGYSCGGDE